MKREDIKKLFPEATEEQITNILNQHNSEVQGEKTKSATDKAELERLKAVETELQVEKDKNLTAEQKLQKALDDANVEKSKFLKETSRLAVKAKLAETGLKEEDYKDILDSFVTEDSEKSVASANAFTALMAKQKADIETQTREKILDETKNPGGGAGGGGDTKSASEKLASDIMQGTKSNTEQATKTIANYQ